MTKTDFDLGEDKRADGVCTIHVQPHADSQVEV